MKKAYLIVIFLLIATGANIYAEAPLTDVTQDTAQVNLLIKQGYNSRLTDYQQTIKKGKSALDMAQKLNYLNGIAEAYRIMGIGEYYASHEEKAISNYLYALNYFKSANNLFGQAKVYNNIGNLYLFSDYDKALEYIQKGLKTAQKLSDDRMIANAYINMGNIYNLKKNFTQALIYYTKSQELFKKLNDPVNLILCSENFGLVYYELKDYDKAEHFLLKSNKDAVTMDLNTTVCSVDLALASLYIDKKNFNEAQKYLDEAKAYAEAIDDDKAKADVNYTSYLLQLNKKNYQAALLSLHSIYTRDSTIAKSNLSSSLNLLKEQHDQQEKQHESDLIIERQKNDRVKFWWAVSGFGLLSVVVILLVNNVQRKAKTNASLKDLNTEISKQKDNLDRINHHLEEIIDERTRDLQIKNKKLSEYSSYLSHQIRGPIATLKGLMNLEKEGLVDEKECISMMNKCVSDIDDKIIDMTEVLHNPKRTSFES